MLFILWSLSSHLSFHIFAQNLIAVRVTHCIDNVIIPWFNLIKNALIKKKKLIRENVLQHRIYYTCNVYRIGFILDIMYLKDNVHKAMWHLCISYRFPYVICYCFFLCCCHCRINIFVIITGLWFITESKLQPHSITFWSHYMLRGPFEAH